jgi:hypothetical protein
MTTVLVMRLVRRFRRATFSLSVCGGLLLSIGAPEARADFIGYYAPSHFTLTNFGGGIDDETGLPSANGKVEVFPDLLTLVLTGMNDGSAIPGYTDFTIPAAASGLFQFEYLFTTEDFPGFQYGGYLIGSEFTLLADEDGAPNASGSVSVFVNAGELIGFRAGGDGQGGLPGVLTVTEFSAPVPEPGTLQLLLIASGAVVAGRFCRRRRPPA